MVAFASAVTHHEASDDCGAAILGEEPNKFWHDHKGAQMNAIRTRTLIQDADIVVVRFGEKYKQWNAAFDAGFASALGKPTIIMHQDEHQHALKEVDAAALAVTEAAIRATEGTTYSTAQVEAWLAGFDEVRRRNIKQAYRIIVRSNLNVTQAVDRLRDEFGPEDDDIRTLIDFIESSERGLVL